LKSWSETGKCTNSRISGKNWKIPMPDIKHSEFTSIKISAMHQVWNDFWGQPLLMTSNHGWKQRLDIICNIPGLQLPPFAIGAMLDN
jgi:hypothetical protein